MSISPISRPLDSALSALMSEKTGVPDCAFARQVRLLGRRLPRTQRSDAQALIQADAMAQHPSLSRQVNQAEVAAARHRLETYLRARDPAAERRGRWLDWLAAISANLLLVLGLLMAALRWRGLI